MLVSYKNQKYEVPSHKWVRREHDFVLMDEHAKPIGRVESFYGAYSPISSTKEFGLSETLEWAKFVVLMETFHPGSIGADAWY